MKGTLRSEQRWSLLDSWLQPSTGPHHQLHLACLSDLPSRESFSSEFAKCNCRGMNLVGRNKMDMLMSAACATALVFGRNRVRAHMPARRLTGKLRMKVTMIATGAPMQNVQKPSIVSTPKIFAFSDVDGMYPQTAAAADLGLFMGFLGCAADYVVVEGMQSHYGRSAKINDGGYLRDIASVWRDHLVKIGLGGMRGLPSVVSLQDAYRLGAGLDAWHPWMWSDGVAAQIGGHVPNNRLCPGWLELHGKAWAAECLAAWHNRYGGALVDFTNVWPSLAAESPQSASTVCNTAHDAMTAAESILQAGWPGAYIKAEFGWAGAGNRRARRNDGEGARRHLVRWLERKVLEGPVLVEPEFQRVMDFSLQIQVGNTPGTAELVPDNKNCDVIRLTFTTDVRGVYRGTELSAGAWDEAWARVVGDRVAGEQVSRFITDSVASVVGSRLRTAGYQGPAGVDGFVYLNPSSGQLFIRPICDINPRYTMSRIAVDVAKRYMFRENLDIQAGGHEQAGVSIALRVTLRSRAESLLLQAAQETGESNITCKSYRITGASLLQAGVAPPDMPHGSASPAAVSKKHYKVIPLTPCGQSWSAAVPPGGLTAMLLTNSRHHARPSRAKGNRAAASTAAVSSRAAFAGHQVGHHICIWKPLETSRRRCSSHIALSSTASEQQEDNRNMHLGELREESLESFARRVLLDGRLASKLRPPPIGLAEQVGAGSAQVLQITEHDFDVEWPVRDEEIRLCTGMKRGSEQLPKVSVILSSLDARAEVLRKFAHHELVACELFAWALLRFPDAPTGLRLGLLRTLAEEQVHCGLYLDRLAALQVAGCKPLGSSLMGPPPLPSYLWQSLKAIKASVDPLLAFLCGIGLTFEASNLDHTLRYRDVFKQAGDEETAAVLQRVHDEEVFHVRFARVWLQRLAKSSLHDVEASDDVELYKRFAAFPPFELQKARGRPMMGVDARRRAGLSDKFIKEVQHAKRRRVN